MEIRPGRIARCLVFAVSVAGALALSACSSSSRQPAAPVTADWPNPLAPALQPVADWPNPLLPEEI